MFLKFSEIFQFGTFLFYIRQQDSIEDPLLSSKKFIAFKMSCHLCYSKNYEASAIAV